MFPTEKRKQFIAWHFLRLNQVTESNGLAYYNNLEYESFISIFNKYFTPSKEKIVLIKEVIRYFGKKIKQDKTVTLPFCPVMSG